MIIWLVVFENSGFLHRTDSVPNQRVQMLTYHMLLVCVLAGMWWSDSCHSTGVTIQYIAIDFNIPSKYTLLFHRYVLFVFSVAICLILLLWQMKLLRGSKNISFRTKTPLFPYAPMVALARHWQKMCQWVIWLEIDINTVI